MCVVFLSPTHYAVSCQIAADRVARSARSIRVGTLRPAIVLYDEPHPYGDEIGAMCTGDLARKPDLLIIMGTSLKVHGIKKLVKDFAKAVHAHPAAASPKNKTGGGKVIFVNKTAPGSEWAGIIDVHVEGETNAWVDKVIRDWKKSRPADWEIQQTLDSTEDSFAVTKRVAGKAGSTWILGVSGDPVANSPQNPRRTRATRRTSRLSRSLRNQPRLRHCPPARGGQTPKTVAVLAKSVCRSRSSYR